MTLAAIMVAAASAAETDEPIEVTLERTACFGWCPDYTVTISGEGTIAYEGRRYVGVTGKRTAHVEPAVVRALVREFEAVDFFSLRDAYRDGDVTDMPSTFVSLRLGKRFKRIEDYVSGPKALRDLEDRIDEVAGTRRWVETVPTPTP